MNPIVTFLLVLVIGIVAGVIAQRGAGRSWLSKQISGTSRAEITSALVGVAGAFIGENLAVLVGVSSGTLGLLVGAIIGSAAILWGWKTLRF
jgi:uncharacterized membrane protein YeaQ/YmgE (transglycosylase-associated protein family)